MTELKIAPGGSASVFVLHEGYAGLPGDDERVAGTVTLITDGDAVIVVDPLGSSAEDLRASRERLLAFATVIVPGHGAAFRPDGNTPR